MGQAWDVRHSPALRALGDRFEVRAVCEEVALRARQAAREFNATPIDGFRALARRDDIDAVLMLSPQWYGALPILAACDAGKAVYCAAAMDLTPEQARTIKHRVEASGIAFMAEFPRRHAPATLRLKELIATSLGPVKLVFCHRRLIVEEASNGQMHPHGHASPMTRELMELVDWCRYVVGGEPTSLVGISHHENEAIRREDYCMMSLDFSDSERPGTGATASRSSCQPRSLCPCRYRRSGRPPARPAPCPEPPWQ